MILPLLILALYVSVPATLLGWTRWLRRKTYAPSSVTRRGNVLLSLTAGLMAVVPLAWGVFGITCVLFMDSRPDDAHRGSVRPLLELLEHVAQGVSAGALAMLTATVVWLAHATWRWRASADAAAPHDGPYR